MLLSFIAVKAESKKTNKDPLKANITYAQKRQLANNKIVSLAIKQKDMSCCYHLSCGVACYGDVSCFLLGLFDIEDVFDAMEEHFCSN